MKKFIITVAAIFLLVISHSKRVAAEEAPPANPYSGDLSSRSTLTGDWWGIRNQLAEKGVTFDLSVTQGV